MTALATDRVTPQREGLDRTLPVAADAVIFAGALVVLNANGYAQPGDATAATHVAAGRAEERVDNTGGENGDITVRVQRGLFRWANSASADAIDHSHIGSLCYVVDDQTVAATDGSSARSAAGTVFDVDAQGVWVITG